MMKIPNAHKHTLACAQKTKYTLGFNVCVCTPVSFWITYNKPSPLSYIFSSTLLKVKVIYWHIWFHEEPFNICGASIPHKVL